MNLSLTAARDEYQATAVKQFEAYKARHAIVNNDESEEDTVLLNNNSNNKRPTSDLEFNENVANLLTEFSGYIESKKQKGEEELYTRKHEIILEKENIVPGKNCPG